MTHALSDRVLVKFHDVAVYFSEEEWERLEDFEKELYRNVMEEIHAAIISLGYKIVNKKLLFRIQPDVEPHVKEHPDHKERDPTTGSPVLTPDILLRIKEVEIPDGQDLSKPDGDSKMSLQIKKEEDPYPIDLPDVKEVLSAPTKMSSGQSRPLQPGMWKSYAQWPLRRGGPDISPDLIVVKTEDELCGPSLPDLKDGRGSSSDPEKHLNDFNPSLNNFERKIASKSLLPNCAPNNSSAQERVKQRKRLPGSTSSLTEKSPNCPRRGTGFMASAPTMKRQRLECPIRPLIKTSEAENSPKSEEQGAILEGEKSPQRLQRHAEIKASEIDILEIERNEKKTRQQTNWAVNVFKSWLKEQLKPETFENLSKSDLAIVLREFYATVRTTDSQQYSMSSYVCMRAGINRHINDPPYSRNFNIMRDSEFNSANNVFLATLKKLKKEGKDAAESHPAISPIDMQKLKNSKVLNSTTPEGLIQTVWFNIQIHFARRGRKGQRELPANAFKIMTDPQGFKYATLAFDEKTKSLTDPREYRGIMYASGRKEQCPVAALEKYLSKLPPNPSSFYLKAKRIPAYLLDSTPVWYENRPLGKNTLGGMMSALSREANLSRIYTNHSIRATSIQILSDAGLETREIMTLTGHKKDSSVRAYWAPTETQRKTWSHLLTLAGTTAENSDKPSTSGGAGNELRLASFVHCRILGAI